MNRARRTSAGVLVGLIVLAALACPAGGGLGCLTEVAVSPTQPTDEDVIDILVWGAKSNPGVVGPTPSFFMSDNSLHLDLYFDQLPGGWRMVIVPWELSLPVGPLPSGWYELTVRAVSGIPPFDVMRERFYVFPQDFILGDLNLSGYVDDDDLSLLLACFNAGSPWGNWCGGDVDKDGYVDDTDLSLLLANWNAGTPPTDGAAVPEPATLGLLAIGGLALIRRRRACPK